MASRNQKRPSISNWFSSLRRQPKTNKEILKWQSSKSLESKQQMQHSCFDLSLTGAGVIDDIPFFGLNETSGSTINSACVRCFCNMLAVESLAGTPSTPATQKTFLKPQAKSRCSLLKPCTSELTHKITSLSPESPPPVSPTLSTKTESDMIHKRELLRIAGGKFGTKTYNKCDQVTHITRTTTTRTLIFSRPIEILFNEKGEIISKRSPSKQSSNSLGFMLDDDGNLSANLSSPLKLNTGEFRFIDDVSTPQNDTEHDLSNINNNTSIRKRSKNISNRIDEKSNLCESCRNLKQIKDELCEVVTEMETLDVPEDCKHSNKDKQMSIGRKKFNMDPKKGIEYLVENRLLRHDPQDVAHFLYKGEGLNKTAIGDYLGEKNDFNEDVLKAFVALHDFTNLILVQALRQFLWSFRLPGEAQKIDRMMECFAQRYCQLNLDIFTNTDTCYVLSFAIIMLNTSLHNPSVKDKPTVEQFISMNRGINNGGDLPRGLLESLYESIRTEPFKIPQDDGNDLMHTFFNPDKEGWLWKQGGRYKSWKRRWFILNDNCLYYFEYTTDKEPRGIIPLENISVREIHDRSKPHCFELFATGGADIIKACKTDSEGKVVEGKHTVYRMSAATEEDQQEWIKRLTQSISHNPFYDILVQRKKKALSKS
ncbi:cytohesin-1 isoform X1 [Drosophila willistoni]|uniref:cytohesin-1 isoform X1 n=1 Tax=Drosophila willistoni TaxID=7260 RepID=UPI000C26C4ED|nr:cytohesin-1 isoform X1 [Drosophila willistoni]